MNKSNIGLLAIVTFATTVLLTAAFGFGCSSGEKVADIGMNVPVPQNNPPKPETYTTHPTPVEKQGTVPFTATVKPGTQTLWPIVSPDGKWKAYVLWLETQGDPESNNILERIADGKKWEYGGVPSAFTPDSKALVVSAGGIRVIWLDRMDKSYQLTNFVSGSRGDSGWVWDYPSNVKWDGYTMSYHADGDQTTGAQDVKINIQTGEQTVTRYPLPKH
jgi:hypothetical protein